MGYYSNLSIDTRTCGEADEDARLDRRDGYYHKPAPRTCEMCREVPATRRVWAETRDGAIVTADVCKYCRDRGGWKGGPMMMTPEEREATDDGERDAREEAMRKTITEHDIIAARQRVAEAEQRGEQQDFADALLASPDLTPEMVEHWLDAMVHVHWCACEKGDHARIVCTECGLPPYWATNAQHLINQAKALVDALDDLMRRMLPPIEPDNITDWEAYNDYHLDRVQAMYQRAAARLERRQAAQERAYDV